MVNIVDVLHLMIEFGMLILALISVVLKMVNNNHKK
nr:putative holin-like toxin [Mammaliicoccus sp. Marseille-Q6498]